jgi:hypothetical protein
MIKDDSSIGMLLIYDRMNIHVFCSVSYYQRGLLNTVDTIKTKVRIRQ